MNTAKSVTAVSAGERRAEAKGRKEEEHTEMVMEGTTERMIVVRGRGRERGG